MKAAVAIKGTKEGLVISLGEGSLDEILSEMDARLTSKASFFLGGRVALRVGERTLTVQDLGAIGRTLQQAGMTLWAVESDDPATHLAARELGLETELGTGPRAGSGGEELLAREDLPGKVVRRSLYAGEQLRFAGHLVIIGDVNVGAEVVAGGDLVVWGKLLGKCFAGALDDDSAVVYALQLAPEQIRIGSHRAQPPERARLPKHPEMASVQRGGIVVERWGRRT